MDKTKEEILYEQLNKQYELNKAQTNAICNVMNSIKSIFKYLIFGFVAVGIVVTISYFWSPDSYSIKVDGNENTMSGQDIDYKGGEN